MRWRLHFHAEFPKDALMLGLGVALWLDYMHRCLLLTLGIVQVSVGLRRR